MNFWHTLKGVSARAKPSTDLDSARKMHFEKCNKVSDEKCVWANVIRGLKEVEATDPTERKTEDIHKVEAVMRDLSIQEPVDIDSLNRINRPQAWRPQDPRRKWPKLLKVILGSEYEKQQVIGRYMEVCENASAAGVGDDLQILPDRTFEERQDRAILARERDARNDMMCMSGFSGKRW